MLTSATVTKRPREVTAVQAAAILYGDWGTSKAYVLGLAFALAAYSSFWLIAAVSVLIALVGTSYITICKFSPSGGGVYASARKRSELLALIGAFFLIADYLITMAISTVSCFEYMGVQHTEYWAMTAILFVGLMNYVGPRHSGNVAFAVSIPVLIVVIFLSLSGLPFLSDAIHSIEPLRGGFWENWNKFVGIIVALSGIEAIANTTGVMRLDTGTTEAHPSVHYTSKKAILWVMLEVCIFTTFLGLLMHALPGLTVADGQVYAPDQVEVRDSMLRYMGKYFVTHHWGNEATGHLFGIIISIVFGVLLLSAMSTALMALVSIVFVMSRDGEFPANFQKLNAFGVPLYPLFIATIIPVLIVLFVHDVANLADMYAVGFVGAIATNLGVNAFDKTHPLSKRERYLMFFTFVIMVLIELTLFIDKPNARRFVIYVMAVGLLLRALVREQRQRQWTTKKVKLKHASLYSDDTKVPLHYGAILCAVSTIGKTLNFALQEAKKYEQPLYILFIREQKIITDEDRMRIWLDDDDACRIFDYAKDSSHEMTIKFFYAVSDSPSDTIVDMSKELHISRLILGRPRHSIMLQVLRGNIVQEVSEILPADIDLLVIS